MLALRSSTACGYVIENAAIFSRFEQALIFYYAYCGIDEAFTTLVKKAGLVDDSILPLFNQGGGFGRLGVASLYGNTGDSRPLASDECTLMAKPRAT